MNEPVPAAAAAPAQSAVVPAPAEQAAPDFRAFEQEQDAADLARASGTGKPPTPKLADAPAGEDAPAVDATGKPVTDAQGKPLSKRQQDANNRIRDAVDRGIATERARAEAAERRAAEAEARLKPAEQPKPAEQVAKPAEDREPTIDDFLNEPDPHTAWMRALNRWDREQERKADDAKRETSDRTARAQQGVEQLVTTHAERETAFKATIPDYDARTLAIRQALDVRMPITQALLRSPKSAELLLHLAEHHDDYQRIGALAVTDHEAALRELWTLEATFAAAPAAPAVPAAPRSTKAPPPGTFLGSQPAPAADAGKAAVARGDFSAFAAEEDAKDLARAGRR